MQIHKPLIFILLIINSFSSKLSAQHTEHNEDIIAKTPNQNSNRILSFLALGDSYTIGQGVQQKYSWPYQLKDTLSTLSVAIDTLTVIAQTGWTTNDLKNALLQKSPVPHDFVSLLIGVNNQYQKKPFTQFKKEFDDLLKQAITLAGGSKNVIIISIPDYGVTPFGSDNSLKIGRAIDKYNSYIKQKAKVEEVSFVDITNVSRSLGDAEYALAEDKLHPSNIQYRKWVELIVPVLLSKLNH
ncbi:SGNH/GDSL hydrolase family protein [Aquimarina brevivitae]|nr:SGNH/GDSL hydrolase family protein [Aquimarina brevivitae]